MIFWLVCLQKRVDDIIITVCLAPCVRPASVYLSCHPGKSGLQGMVMFVCVCVCGQGWTWWSVWIITQEEALQENKLSFVWRSFILKFNRDRSGRCWKEIVTWTSIFFLSIWEWMVPTDSAKTKQNFHRDIWETNTIISSPYLGPVLARSRKTWRVCNSFSLSVFLRRVRSADSKTLPLPCVVFLPSGPI